MIYTGSYRNMAQYENLIRAGHNICFANIARRMPYDVYNKYTGIGKIHYNLGLNPKTGCNNFAPSEPLFRAAKAGMNRNEFNYHYINQLCSIDENTLNKLLSVLSGFSGNPQQHIVLLCWEQDPRFCHRKVLAENFLSRWFGTITDLSPDPSWNNLPRVRNVQPVRCFEIF